MKGCKQERHFGRTGTMKIKRLVRGKDEMGKSPVRIYIKSPSSPTRACMPAASLVNHADMFWQSIQRRKQNTHERENIYSMPMDESWVISHPLVCELAAKDGSR